MEGARPWPMKRPLQWSVTDDMRVAETIPDGLNDSGMTPEAHVRQLARRSGTSFFWAMRMLPKAKRHGMYAVYAFCREVDDIADGDLALDRKHEGLDFWRSEIATLFDGGQPASLTGRSLRSIIREFGCRRADFEAVIDGVAMDAGPRVRIADEDVLRLYCDRVASAVGRLSNRVFGISDELGDPVADSLGQALQRTNILRDVVEDAERDRLYIPQSLLRTRGLGSDASLDEILNDAALIESLAVLAEDTKRLYEEARTKLSECDRDAMRPAMAMMRVYEKVFSRMRNRGWVRYREAVSLGNLEKLLIGLRFGLFG